VTEESGGPPGRRPIPETPPTGLSAADVVARTAKGLTNDAAQRTSRTLTEILRANVLTRFNFLLGALLAVILVAGRPQDALFGIVLVSNALIGIVQEIRAKRTLDRLAVLNAPRASVVRDGTVGEVAVEEVVLDDLVSVRTGDQIVADGTVRTTDVLQVDESLLTGESEPVEKHLGDDVLSGSFVVAGSGRFQATGVGPDAYAATLATAARRFTLARSEIMDGIDQLLRYVTWAIVPVAALLLFSQVQSSSGWRDAASGVVAGLVAMVPQGLVLLTSIAFAVAAVTLARRNVLVQELPAVEGLARVDVVCFDKTGTLTDGTIAFDRLELIDESFPAGDALGALADDEHANATLAAVARAFAAPSGWRRSASTPFSSARKWSGASFEGRGTVLLGAPEMILEGDDAVLARAASRAGTGRRVLLLAASESPLDGDRLPGGVRPVALVLLKEQVRPDAADTLAYFARQGVDVKVISGDSARTVGAVAVRVGVRDAGHPVDGRDLPEDPSELGLLLEERAVFGRVTPEQKQAMVTALQARGHTVAMTGDGVNDALALKLADIGVAMGSGAPATRAVAQVVLLDGSFATLPGVVAEGRRVAANIERVANLFITKTVWATVLAVAVGIARWPYPFLPRHLTVIDALVIGVPAFFLALAPNERRYRPGFVGRVLRFAIPAGLVVAATAFTAFWLTRSHHLPVDQQRSASVLVTVMVSLGVLVALAVPLTWRKVVLVGWMVVGFLLLFPVVQIRRYFELALPHAVLGWTLLVGSVGVVVFAASWATTRRTVGEDGTAGAARRRPIER